MKHWYNSAGAMVTNVGAAGDYTMNETVMRPDLDFGIGAKALSGSFTVQLWVEIGGARANLGAATTVAVGTPVLWPDQYSMVGQHGITVAATTAGVLEVAVDQ